METAMSTPEIPNKERSKKAVFPRWMALIYFVVMFPLGLVVAPWGLSLLSPRYGWVMSHPAVWNLFLLILIVAGIACTIWILVLHFVQAPEGWELERTPKYLLMDGPYKFTRNPIYLSELAIWLGWTLFYGSVAVFIGYMVWWVALNYVVVPWEERNLESRFGEAYLQYKRTVPRWLGKS